MIFLLQSISLYSVCLFSTCVERPRMLSFYLDGVKYNSTCIARWKDFAFSMAWAQCISNHQGKETVPRSAALPSQPFQRFVLCLVRLRIAPRIEVRRCRPFSRALDPTITASSEISPIPSLRLMLVYMLCQVRLSVAPEPTLGALLKYPPHLFRISPDNHML